MPHDILNSMRALREDMRQRLLQVPEYRALMALDRSIEEICGIMQDALTLAAAPVSAPEAAAAPATEAPQPAPAPRPNSIASAFAETLAAKMDQRQVGRVASPYAPGPRALGA